MKKKLVVALLAAMTLSFGTFGVVNAAAENPEERPGYVWVIDSEEEGHFETVHHEEEGHYENVQVGTEPVYEAHRCVVCNLCGAIMYDYAETPYDEAAFEDAVLSHEAYHGTSISYKTTTVDVQVGENPIYEERWVVDVPAYEEQVLVSEAWDEKVLVSEAWDEKVWIVDVPEEGHWEPVESTDPETPVEPEEPTDSDQPENPDPENPNEEEPTTPVEPETPDTDNDGSDQETIPTPEKPTADADQVTNEDTTPDSENTAPEDTSTDQKQDGQVTAPQTGDPGSLGHIISLAGSTLAGGSALVWKFWKRK